MASVQSALVRAGYKVEVCGPDDDSPIEVATDFTPEVIVLDDICAGRAADVRRVLSNECGLKEILVISVATEDQANEADLPGVGDFLIQPYTPGEFLARLRLLLWRTTSLDRRQTRVSSTFPSCETS